MIYLYGAGGHAKVVIELLEQEQIIISGLIDNGLNDTSLLGYPIYSTFEELSTDDETEMILCVGNNASRKKLADKLSVKYGKAIHPSANISLRSTIGEGSVIMAGVSVNSGVVAGRHVILNTGCVIDHDCDLKDFVHISPNVALAGNVRVGEGTHIGLGSCVIQGIKIGNWVTIGAGAVIINDVPDHAVVMGNPGKIIKYKQPDN